MNKKSIFSSVFALIVFAIIQVPFSLPKDVIYSVYCESTLYPFWNSYAMFSVLLLMMSAFDNLYKLGRNVFDHLQKNKLKNKKQ